MSFDQREIIVSREDEAIACFLVRAFVALRSVWMQSLPRMLSGAEGLNVNVWDAFEWLISCECLRCFFFWILFVMRLQMLHFLHMRDVLLQTFSDEIFSNSVLLLIMPLSLWWDMWITCSYLHAYALLQRFLLRAGMSNRLWFRDASFQCWHVGLLFGADIHKTTEFQIAQLFTRWWQWGHANSLRCLMHFSFPSACVHHHSCTCLESDISGVARSPHVFSWCLHLKCTLVYAENESSWWI